MFESQVSAEMGQRALAINNSFIGAESLESSVEGEAFQPQTLDEAIDKHLLLTTYICHHELFTSEIRRDLENLKNYILKIGSPYQSNDFNPNLYKLTFSSEEQTKNSVYYRMLA